MNRFKAACPFHSVICRTKLGGKQLLGGLGDHSGGILAYFGMTSTPFGVFVWFTLNDFGPFQKNMFLSISMMSCNFTVKLGRIQKDSDGSERRVCIRVCICI